MTHRSTLPPNHLVFAVTALLNGVSLVSGGYWLSKLPNDEAIQAIAHGILGAVFIIAVPLLSSRMRLFSQHPITQRVVNLFPSRLRW